MPRIKDTTCRSLIRSSVWFWNGFGSPHGGGVLKGELSTYISSTSFLRGTIPVNGKKGPLAWRAFFKLTVAVDALLSLTLSLDASCSPVINQLQIRRHRFRRKCREPIIEDHGILTPWEPLSELTRP